jgi:hypothetical protein
MKIKHLLTKTLLVAAGLCLGAGNVWADVTQVIDFKTFTASQQPDITLSSTPISQSGTNALTVYQLTNSGTYFDRVALSHKNKDGVQMRWMFRNGSNAWQYGLCGNWNNGGTANTSYNISVLDLYAGDRVTFTYEIRAGKDAQPKFCSAGVVTSGSPATANTAGSALVSGTTYTMTSDGNLDLFVTNDNLGIRTITIVSSHVAESIDVDPVVSVSGANGGNREVTITSSKTNTDNATVTYYTKDGSDPSTSSTLYAGAFNVTAADATEGVVTIKAITYKDGDASIKSGITSFNVTGVGTTIKLANPVVKLSGMTESAGVYNPSYTFSADAAGTFGSPSITLTATFNGNPIDAASYTATATGTIRVVASATGYADSDPTDVEVTGVGYELLKSIDVADLYPGETSEWPTGLDYNLIPGLTIDPVNNTNGCTYRTKHNADAYYTYYGRNKGFTVTCTGLTSDMLVVIEDYTRTNKYVITAASNSVSIPTNGTFKYYTLYAQPGATVSVNVSAAGMATYVPSFDLNFSSASLKAYTAEVSGKGVCTLHQIDEIPAGTPVLLIGATENIPVMTGATAVSEPNNLVAGAGAAVATTDGGYTNMILNNGTSGVGFYLAAGQIVAANRAYLHFDSSLAPDPSAPMMMVFDGEATGISEIKTMRNAENEIFFDLQGRKVAQPAKGLYIVNGKKVVIK